MNVTERVILEQFPFWDGALKHPLPTLPATLHVFVGCGTSHYLAQALASAFNLSGRPAIAVPGAEWARRPEAYLADRTGVHVITLSRSGESTETIQAAEASRRAGLPTWAITCAPDTPIEHAVDVTIYAETHVEEGIVMTASASLMLLIGLRLAGVTLPPGIATEARTLLDRFNTDVGTAISGRSHFVCLGAGPLYGIANEAALKLQEMSLSYAQAFHPMEYRHGPVSLVDDRTLVTLLYSQDTQAEEAALAEGLRAKGAFVIGFGGPGDLSYPVAPTGAARALAVLPALQILGERVAGAKGIDTVTPRHLTKVVTLG